MSVFTPHLLEGRSRRTGIRKNLTLRQFEVKYDCDFLELAENTFEVNLRSLWQALPPEEQTDELKQALRWLDVNVNINWPLVTTKAPFATSSATPNIAAPAG